MTIQNQVAGKQSLTRVAGKNLRKVGVGGAVLLIAAATATAGAGVANANATFSFDRIAGLDRAATSAQTADVFGPTTDAIIANGSNEHSVDALSAAYLAGVKQAPILLTKNAIQPVPPTVLAQLKANGVKNVTIVGGTDSVTPAQETELKNAGYTVTRIEGATRFDTSNNIIKTAGAASGNTALLTTGRNFADALGASTLSYAKKIPVAITEPASVAQTTLDTLKAAGITNIVVAGGPTAVSQNVRNQLAAAGFTVDNTTLNGNDRADTSVKLANFELTTYGFSNTGVNVASGAQELGGADALGGGALSGKELRPLLVTQNVNDVRNLPTFLAAHCTTLANGHIFGDTSAVSQSAQDVLTAAAKCTTPPVNNQTFTVTPGSPQTANINTAVQFTVSGLGTAPVDIVLFDCNNVQNNNGTVTFPGSTNPGQAGNFANANIPAGANISVVNGTATAGNTGVVNGVVPNNGAVTFSVTEPNNTCVVPVVFQQGTGANANNLALGTNNQPTAPFGVGGATTFVTPGATGAITPGGSVTSANGTSFTEGGQTFTYKNTDVFQLVQNNTGVRTTVPETFADFQQRLSQGDQVTGFNQSPNQSTFVLDDLAPRVASVTATPNTSLPPNSPTSGGVNLSIVPSTTSPNVTSFNVYRTAAVASSPATGAPSICPPNAGTPGLSPQVSPTAPYTQIGSVSATAAQNTAGAPYTFTDATPPATATSTTTFCYLVSAVQQNAAGSTQQGTGTEANTNAPGVGGVSGITPGNAGVAPVNIAPKFVATGNSATFVPVAGALNITVTYNEPITLVDAGDYAVVATDANGIQRPLTVISAVPAGLNQAVITATAPLGTAALTDTPGSGSVTVTAQKGLDGNTVGNVPPIGSPQLFQAEGDSVFIAR